jgi:hypothetical protein
LFVNGNEVLEFGSLWVEGVFEVVGGDWESESGVGDGVFEEFIVFEMLCLSPSVFFLFTSKFKVQILNKVLKGSHKFTKRTSSLKLKFH